MQATSGDLCTLERSGYLACTVSPPESTPNFTDIICSALVSVEELDSVEDVSSATLGFLNAFGFGLIELSFI